LTDNQRTLILSRREPALPDLLEKCAARLANVQKNLGFVRGSFIQAAKAEIRYTPFTMASEGNRGFVTRTAALGSGRFRCLWHLIAARLFLGLIAIRCLFRHIRWQFAPNQPDSALRDELLGSPIT
jgi:hypothetical protein